MAIRTRSMQRTRSDAELYMPAKQLPVSPVRSIAKQRSRLSKASHVVADDRQTRRTPRTPSQQQRRSKRLPSTPTTTSSPSANRPNRPARPQLTTSQSVPILLDAQANSHTTRFLPESKVAHLKSWLEAQSPADALLDPKTPVRRPDMSKWLQQRRNTRAHDSPSRGDWRREIDELSIAPVTPSRGLVRKLEAAFESLQQQKTRPP